MKVNLPILFLTFVCSTAIPVVAQQNPEAAARQALIDADQAQVKINQAQKRIEDAVIVDGDDAVSVESNEELINQQNIARERAQRRELREEQAMEGK